MRPPTIHFIVGRLVAVGTLVIASLVLASPANADVIANEHFMFTVTNMNPCAPQDGLVGAPPLLEITLLFAPTSFAWSAIPPSASATPGSPRTFASSDSGKDGGVTPWFALPPIALLPVMTASVFLYTWLKTVPNAAFLAPQ